MVWKKREVLSNIEAILMIGSLVFKLVTAKLDTQSCYNYQKSIVIAIYSMWKEYITNPNCRDNTYQVIR